MNKIELLLTKIVLNIFYSLFSIYPIDKRKVVFATPRNDTGYGNIRYIIDEIKRQNLDYKCVLLVDKYGYGIWEKIKYLLKLIMNTYDFATAKFLILDNAYLPVHVIRHRKQTTVIQTWHACGAFKKFGLSTKGLQDGIKEYEESFLHKGYDIAISSSKKINAYYAEAFGMDEKQILALGVPRTDFFFNEQKIAEQREKVRMGLPQIGKKKVILYAPTFRGRGQEKYIELPFDIRNLKEKLYPEYHLIIKSHPHASIKDPIFFDQKFVALIHNKYSLNELFTVTDILVTDYSSGIYEFALLNKPMIFFAYDLDNYKQTNEFYENYDTFVPGPIVKNEEELIEAIKEEKCKDYDITKFAKENFDYLDGQASRRFVELLAKSGKP